VQFLFIIYNHITTHGAKKENKTDKLHQIVDHKFFGKLLYSVYYF